MSFIPSADVWWIFASQAVIGKVKMFQPLLFLKPGWSWSCWIAIFTLHSSLRVFKCRGFLFCFLESLLYIISNQQRQWNFFTHPAEFGFVLYYSLTCAWLWLNFTEQTLAVWNRTLGYRQTNPWAVVVWAKRLVLTAKYGDHCGIETGGLEKDLSLDGKCAEKELRDSGKLVWRGSKIRTFQALGLERRKLG